ncbi:putative serine/threonine-protein kinase PBL5, partial [Bienertia sinuspersici]
LFQFYVVDESSIFAYEEPWLSVGRRFEYRDLEGASNDFREDNRLGDGASSVVYRGIIDNRESKWQFTAEVLTIRRANHPNIMGFIWFCAEEAPTKATLDWNTRMKIVVGAARGLAYLHSQMNPLMIFRDMKSANILLGEGYKPKLSDFGNAIDGPVGCSAIFLLHDRNNELQYLIRWSLMAEYFNSSR